MTTQFIGTSNYDLVELTGTPKQVAWANDIRAKMIRQTEEHVDFASVRNSGKGEIADAAALRMAEAANSKPEASWWIEHCGTWGARLFNDLFAELLDR